MIGDLTLADCVNMLISRPILRDMNTNRDYSVSAVRKEGVELLERKMLSKPFVTARLDGYAIVEWEGHPVEPPFSLKPPAGGKSAP